MFDRTLERLASTPTPKDNLDQNGHITREEFRLYRQAQEKEGLIDRIRSSLGREYKLATLNGVAATLCAVATPLNGAGTLYHMSQDNPTAAAIYGAITLFTALATVVNTGFIGYKCAKISTNREQIRTAEEELEQIRENPAYKRLDSIE